MTKHERDEVLSYVAEHLISTLYWEGEKNGMTAKEIYLEWSGNKFNKLCVFVDKFVEENSENPLDK